MNLESNSQAAVEPVKPLGRLQRRILGVLMEKAKTTPDAYPMTLNGIVTAANQKSNRHPLMNVTAEQVEDELINMRQAGLVTEVHGSGRVAKFRHHGYDYLGVKGTEAGVMTELLLRGEQTAGELRTRASRFEAIADLPTLTGILSSLMDRGLVIALTPAGRGQLVTHNLYLPDELQSLRARAGSETAALAAAERISTQSAAVPSAQIVSTLTRDDPGRIDALEAEIADLRSIIEDLRSRIETLES